MLFVSFVEIGIMVRVVLGALIFKNSFMAPLFYAAFLRLRYFLSPATRKAFTIVNQHIDHWINAPSCPAAVKNGVNGARDLIMRYAESAVLGFPGQQPQPAPAAAAAPNARPAAQ